MRLLALGALCGIAAAQGIPGIGSVASVAAGPYYQRTVTISHTVTQNTNQANFPYLLLFNSTNVSTTLKTVANGGHVQNANGYDILLSTTTCGSPTLMAWDVVHWSATTGVWWGFVNIASLSFTTDTVIYLCYGNPSISTFQGGPASSVYPSGTQSWYHMEGSGSSGATVTDALGNNNGTVVTDLNSESGEVSLSLQNVNSPGSYVDLGSGNFNIFNGTTTKWIIGMWINPASVTTSTGCFPFGQINSPGSGGCPRLECGSDSNCGHGSGFNGCLQLLYGSSCSFPNYALVAVQSSSISAGSFQRVWAYLDLVNTSLSAIWLNGSKTNATYASGGTAPVVFGTLVSGDDLTLFRWTSNGGLDGYLDEVSIHNAVPWGSNVANDWIATDYNNQSAPLTYETVSAES